MDQMYLVLATFTLPVKFRLVILYTLETSVWTE